MATPDAQTSGAQTSGATRDGATRDGATRDGARRFKLLVCAVVKGAARHAPLATAQCTTGFASSMIQLQAALLHAPMPFQLAVEPVRSVAHAAELCADSGFDAVAAISADVGFSPGFVLRAVSSAVPFVAGVYPLPSVDWARVERTATASESPAFVGNTYNIDLDGARLSSGGYAHVDGSAIADLGAVVLSAEAARAVAAAKPGSDADVARAWGKPVSVDVTHQLSSFGPAEFLGCLWPRVQAAQVQAAQVQAAQVQAQAQATPAIFSAADA